MLISEVFRSILMPWAVCIPHTYTRCAAPWCRWGERGGFSAQVHSPAGRMEPDSGCGDESSHPQKRLQITAFEVPIQ